MLVAATMAVISQLVTFTMCQLLTHCERVKKDVQPQVAVHPDEPSLVKSTDGGEN